MRKNQGSAILAVVGATAVLVVLALSFIGSKQERANISRLMSDEKKVESIAESVNDLILSHIKVQGNNKSSIFYYLFRAPAGILSLDSGKNGENKNLDVSLIKPINDLDSYVQYSKVLDPVIADIGWTDRVKITTKCEISNAEYFAPAINEYKVAAVSNSHLDAMGKSSKFLDLKADNIRDYSVPSEEDLTLWENNPWKLKIRFPSGNPTSEDKSFKVHVKSDTAIADLMKDKNDRDKALSEARRDLLNAKAELERAKNETADEDYLKECEKAVKEAEKKEKEVSEDYEQFMEEFRETDTSVSGGLGVKVTLKVTRPNEDSLTFGITAKISGVLGFIARILHIKNSYTLDPVDCLEKIKEANIFPQCPELNMPSLRSFSMEGKPNYEFTNYVKNIKNRFQAVKNQFETVTDSSWLNNNNIDKNYIIEKGGILRITTHVEYKKDEKKTFTKTLVTELPFKTTDLQPIAPEYSFFIANSPLISNQQDIISKHTLGQPVEMNNIGNSTNTVANLPAGQFIVHHLPFNDNKPSYSAVGPHVDDRLPGMVRINCNYTKKQDPVTVINSFLGTMEEPELTEMNQIFTPQFVNSDKSLKDYDGDVRKKTNTNRFNAVPSFCWSDNKGNLSNHKRLHDVEFPILFDHPEKQKKIEVPGVTGFLDVYRRGGFNIVVVPTLLYGMSHMEYPLGLNAEGPIRTAYTRICVSAFPNALVCPKAEKEVTDVSEIFYSYEPVTSYSNGGPYNFDRTAYDVSLNGSTQYEAAHYGMTKHPCYGDDGLWASNSDYKYMPANCFDTMQYAKKATRFYNTSAEFLDDCKKQLSYGGLLTPDGTIVVNGVYYIKDDDLILQDMKFTGKGLIVVKKSIRFEGNVNIVNTGSNDDGINKSVIGFIARVGNIQFASNKEQTVEGSFFSNNAPISNSPKLKIYGNLVCNDFVRKNMLDVEVFYNNQLTTVSSLATLRKIGKFEPERYTVTFADNISKFAYDKN